MDHERDISHEARLMMSRTLIFTAVIVLTTIYVKCTNVYCRGNETEHCGQLCHLINTYSKTSCVAFVHNDWTTTKSMYVKFTRRQNVQKQCNK